MAIKILIVDDHPFTRAGLRLILEPETDMKIVGEASDGMDAIHQTGKLQPDIVVMDISMPNMSGIEATTEILKKYPEVKVIALSIHAGERYVKEMLSAGSSGYLLKDEAPEELIRAINKVFHGEMFLSSAVTRAALSNGESIKEVIDKKVLLSKLHRPPVLTDYVIRTRIIQKLESNVVKPLSMISAGAGYGKSVTVSQWLEQSQALYSWISLDEELSDFRTFLSYLIVAVEKVFPGLLNETHIMISAPLMPPVKELANTLINALCDIDMDFILVFEDYHVIKDKRIHELLDHWLLFPPPNVHLCLVTRMDPPLKLSPLRLSGRMTEIRMDELSFSKQEVSELFRLLSIIEPDDKSLEILLNKTEGWIISLRLIAMLIKDQEDIERTLESIESRHQSISEFLLTEVLSAQEESLQEKLITVSILDRFCEEVIGELFNDDHEILQSSSNGKELIHWLVSMNMFVIPLDSDRRWFRYHHLFKDFLIGQLKKRKSEKEVSKIHIRASKWLEKNGFLTEAINHASKANDNKCIVRIIRQHWEDTFDEDYWTTVDEWLSYVPEETINQTANLLLARMWVEMRRHQIQRFPALIELIEKTGEQLTNTEKGYLAFAKCALTYFMGDPQKASQYAEEALALIPAKHKSFRADSAGWHTPILTTLGNGELAVQIADEALQHVEPPGEPIQTTRRTMHPSFVYITNANLHGLKERIEQFFKIPEISPYMLGFGWYFKGAVSWWSYNQESVIQYFEKALEYRYHSVGRQGIDCYICLTLIYQELGKPKEAIKTIDDGLQFTLDLEDPASHAVGLSGKARLNMMQGNMEAAEEWVSSNPQTDLDLSMLWWVEVPAMTHCRILIARETPEGFQKAVKKLEDFRIFAESVFNKMRTIDILVLQTVAYLKLNEEQNALNTLRDAIALAAGGNWIRPFAEHIDNLSKHLTHFREQGINSGFIDLIFSAVEKAGISMEQESTVNDTAYSDKKERLIKLTPKELEVLQYIAQGLRNQEIADKLFNSQETIKRHIYNMFQKLNVKNRLSLVTKAKEEGILTEQGKP
jgi:LuxR family maltose regulon positive regulatory protein